MGGQFTGSGPGYRCKIDRNRCPRFLLPDALVDAVSIVCRLAFDVALGGEQFFALGPDFIVDMRAAPSVGDGFNRAKEIFPAAAGKETAEALEIDVPLIGIAEAAMKSG